eukprot:1161655-Pelagomonas_calceolata.AAC.8
MGVQFARNEATWKRAPQAHLRWIDVLACKFTPAGVRKNPAHQPRTEKDALSAAQQAMCTYFFRLSRLARPY